MLSWCRNVCKHNSSARQPLILSCVNPSRPINIRLQFHPLLFIYFLSLTQGNETPSIKLATLNLCQSSNYTGLLAALAGSGQSHRKVTPINVLRIQFSAPSFPGPGKTNPFVPNCRLPWYHTQPEGWIKRKRMDT